MHIRFQQKIRLPFADAYRITEILEVQYFFLKQLEKLEEDAVS